MTDSTLDTLLKWSLVKILARRHIMSCVCFCICPTEFPCNSLIRHSKLNLSAVSVLWLNLIRRHPNGRIGILSQMKHMPSSSSFAKNVKHAHFYHVFHVYIYFFSSNPSFIFLFRYFCFRFRVRLIAPWFRAMRSPLSCFIIIFIGFLRIIQEKIKNRMRECTKREAKHDCHLWIMAFRYWIRVNRMKSNHKYRLP